MLPICYKSPCSLVYVFTAWTENSALFQCCTPLLILWYFSTAFLLSDHNVGTFACILSTDSGSARLHSSDLCMFAPSIVKFWYLFKILHKLYFTVLGCTDTSSVYVWFEISKQNYYTHRSALCCKCLNVNTSVTHENKNVIFFLALFLENKKPVLKFLFSCFFLFLFCRSNFSDSPVTHTN